MFNNNRKRTEGNAFSFNYNEDALKACIRARLIADMLQTNIVTPIHMFWALTLNPMCPIQSYLAEDGYGFDAVTGMDRFFSNPDSYEYVTKEEYPLKHVWNNLQDNQENNQQDDSQNSQQNDRENNQNSEEGDNNQKQISDETLKEEAEILKKITNGDIPISIVIDIGNNKDVEPALGLTMEDFKIEYSETMMEILKKTGQNCLSAKQNYIDADNLFYQLLSSEDESLKILLEEALGLEPEEILDYMEKKCKIFADYSQDTISIPRALRNCCTIINNKYTQTDECDILGRDEEVALLWNIFSKKTKRNAILVGEPGVGKTAIMEALTMQIVKGTCPEKFCNHYVIELSLVGIVSGTKYRGEFEQKIECLTTFLENTNNVILYVDEIHQMLGAGSTEDDSMCLSGALKPILARDNVILVGATTTREYEKILSKDGAFKRRFEVVDVEEPKHNKVKPMIRKRVETLTKFHGVEVSEEILDRIITLAYAFNTTTSNPDKTIDLLDRSMAKAVMCKDKKLKEEHIQSIFDKNFKLYKKQPKTMNTSVAYHEAGHYVALRVYENILHYKPILVSIVPTDVYAGVTKFELPEYLMTDATKEYIYANIILDLAGRVSQYEYTKKLDAGASSDLRSANQRIEEMLSEYGMYTDYENLVLPYDFSNTHQMSDEMLNELREKKKKILTEKYAETENMIKKNKAAIQRIVKLLLEKQIATAEELDVAYKG